MLEDISKKYKLIDINLQFFSEEKTEEPTEKKKQDTRKKGQVLQSRELTGAVTLIVAILMIKFKYEDIIKAVLESMNFFKQYFYTDDLTSVMGAYRIFIYMLVFSIKSLLYIILPVFLTAFVVSRVQVGKLFTTDPLKMKFDRINPIEGFKRMFSTQAVFNLLKSLLKIIFVGMVGYSYVKKNMVTVMKTYQLGEKQYTGVLFYFAINLALRMAFSLLLLGVLDYMYQRHSYNKNLKMSKQEIKEEYKQTEGDPQVKSKIKERQRQAAMKRMMQELPKADVIITNPTHIACAIVYDEKKYDAPYLLAKGADLVAMKIKEKARELEIPIIENKPVARAIYSTTELGDVIQPELYEAVAEILAYVYSLEKSS